MLGQYSHLKKNLDTFDGKINFVVYNSAIVLLIMHLLFSIFYITKNIYLMNIINTTGILTYIYYVLNGIKDEKKFAFYTYFHVLLYAILATICFGWSPGFYLWFFALICAYFLPSFGNTSNNIIKRPIYIGIIYVLSYFILGFLCPTGVINPLYKIKKIAIVKLFGINSFITFFTIIAFTYFYTTRQKAKEFELRRKADYDNLTGLKNRNSINYLIESRLANKKNKFSIAIIDIDFFKNVNDTYGHNAGDYVLKEIAKLMSELEGFGIICGRWGGEEFILIGPYDMKTKQFIDILNAFRRTVREHKFTYEKSIIKVTVSIGGAEYNKSRTIKNTIELADKNLYKAKQTGRNKTIYS